MISQNTIGQLEEIISELLNGADLSCTFIPENSKSVEFEITQALGKQGVIGIISIPDAELAGMYEASQIAFEIPDLQVKVVENPTVNRSKQDATGQEIAFQVLKTLTAVKTYDFGKFQPVKEDQETEGQLIVDTAHFKALVYKEDSL